MALRSEDHWACRALDLPLPLLVPMLVIENKCVIRGNKESVGYAQACTRTSVAALPAAHNQTKTSRRTAVQNGCGSAEAAMRREGPKSLGRSKRQLTSRPSLRHLVSRVLVLIHDGAVYLQHWEAS
jgi:hypothetical protein